ncbi:MAG: heavy metal translocating P-type ATPase [Cyanobacteria bacterium SBLK]|nr:heavy metal translocating P-type ATPase [Cyanobacteria bacterium SBLK]
MNAIQSIPLNSASVSQIVHSLPGRMRLRVPQLICDRHYAANLEYLLNTETIILRSRINRAAASVIIHYHYSQHYSLICDRIADLLEKAHCVEQEDIISPEEKKEENGANLTLPTIAILLALGSRKLPILRPVAAGTLGLIALPIARRALQSIVGKHRLNIDCLDFLALAFSGLQKRLITPALVVALHELGDLIREQTARATELQTADLMDAIGHFAWVDRDGEIQQVQSNRVESGETVIVYPGEQIPVDGTVLQGTATIDQQQLTGESMPVVAETGTYVYASTLARSGKLRIRAERIGRETRAAASIELLQKAPVYDTRMANYAGQIADKLILPALVLATIVLAATREPARAASILTLDFVTGIRISIPTAFLGALNHVTRHGVLVRSGRTLEQLAEIDTIVFDKTGTLTCGDVRVVKIDAVAGVSSDRVLCLAAAAEQRLTHPVAEAIVRYAEERGISIPPRHNLDYRVGAGIYAEIEGDRILVGSAKFLQKAGIAREGLEGCENPEQSAAIFVARNGKLQGAIHYEDPLRPESTTLIHRLQEEYTLEVHLLTGDNQQRADRVAKLLKIEPSRTYAEAFPEQKAKIVRDLHHSGHIVAFVGDGLNDSVALAYADVSVSFEQGSDVARETADVVLMNNDLESLLEAIAIARATKRLIEQNTALVVGPNLIALGLASTVGLNPLLATIVHNGSAIAAGLNSLRPLLQHQLENRNSPLQSIPNP